MSGRPRVDWLEKGTAQPALAADLPESKVGTVLDLDIGTAAVETVPELSRDVPGPARPHQEWLGVRQDGRILLVRVAEIEWIEAQRNNVILHTGGSQLRKRRAMWQMESLLDPRVFVRIERRVIVRIDFVQHFTPRSSGGYLATLKNGTCLPLSPTFLERSELLREVLTERHEERRHVPRSGSEATNEEK